MKREYQVGGDHYTMMRIQPFDVIETWPIEQQIGAFRMNALKYIMRMGSKGSDLEDAQKAEHYAHMLVNVLSEGEQ